MIEIEVYQHTTLWLSVLSPDQVLILTVNIPQECLTEVVIIAVVVHSEVLVGRERLLLALGHDVDRCLNGNIYLSDVRRHLELDLILFLLVHLDIFIGLRDGDVVNLVNSLQSDLSLFEQSQVGQLSLIQDQGRLNKYLSPSFDK
jgi:hypothetical protein